MIKTLKIENLQSHEHSVLQFNRGVNVIVGSSDSGKSAIIRALKLLIKNKPSGDDLRSWWGGETAVTIETSSDTIERIKGKKNLYKLNGITFAAFGANVPDEIKKALNMSDINLQEQFDSHFLLSKSDSPGKVAAFFNKIAKFEKIDTSLSFVNSKITKIKGNISHNKEIKKEKEKELKSYAVLDSLLMDVKLLVSSKNKFEVVKTKYQELEQLEGEIHKVDSKLKEVIAILESKIDINLLEATFTKRDKASRAYQKLKESNKQIQKLKEEITETAILSNLKKDVNELIDRTQSNAKLDTKFNALSTLEQSISRIEKDSAETLQMNLQLSKQFKKEMGDTCILCNSKLV